MSEPLPNPTIVPDLEIAPFWEATNRGTLLLCRCESCAAVVWYPRPFCPNCGSTEVHWFESAGVGSIYTYTVARKAGGAFEAATPYVIGFVELDEGPRILTNIVGVDPDAVRIGQRVSVVFEPAGEHASIYRFAPIEPSEGASA